MKTVIILAVIFSTVLCSMSYADHVCMSQGGQCQHTSQFCKGTYISGLCEGPAKRQCCLNEAALLKFGVLCNGYSGNVKRRCDSYGCGNYGAKRGGHLHKGLDIKCSDGSTVYAPFDAKLNGQARPYGNGNLIDDGITLSGKGVCVKLFYVKPFNYRGSVKKGDKIGNLLPMQKVYSGITSHIHVQMCDKSDPTPYL
ncbi:leukocyte cell-derived chemotaxin-2-like [Huso huso]|uniref:Leukocyte cell-derived chemotaxin-2-like n=1 Tax=Huso huso TaxID=61971 RepID=A0ABR0YQ66_HUSHU